MLVRIPLVGLLLVIAQAQSQTTCDGTPAYSPCELTFELSGAEAVANPNPYTSIEFQAEFRSPRFHTYLMPGFWDGDRKLVIRFSPSEAGAWTYRLTSNLPSLEGKQGTFTAAESDAPGYVHAANVHHWATDNKQPHLWMGWILDGFGSLSPADFEQALTSAAAAKFNHVRGSILGSEADQNHAFSAPDHPNFGYFDELDRRFLSVHKRRIVADVVLASNPDALVKLFPDWQSRKRFIRFAVARYGSLNITWQGLEEFEGHANGRPLLKEIGLALKALDPYQHPRSSNARVTSSPLLSDGWMDFIIDHSGNDQIGSVEHQLYQVPFVGITTVQHLWNATMNGQYPVIEGTFRKEPQFWFNILSDTRHWELEPYFDLDAARAIALEDTEYVVYVEKSAPIELTVEKHGYDVLWFDPEGGEMREQKKYKGEHFTGQPPSGAHPWILLVAREGRKESMLKSYKFESRLVPVQELEQNPQKVPFQITLPATGTLSLSAPANFGVKLTRETRATRSMMYVWTGEVPADGQGFRVLGTGAQGSFRIPSDIASRFPAVLSIRLNALNANGKAYSADKVYTLTK
ncbi:MAG: DUF5060 domain-containing protein [Acidobacteriota bacterium]|nr:DUF5060 domain-containing protein [Acidobacteriota bacterium]